MPRTCSTSARRHDSVAPPWCRAALSHEVDITTRLAYTKALIRRGVTDGSLRECLAAAKSPKPQQAVHKQQFKIKRIDVAALVGLNAFLVYGVTLITW